MLSVKLHAENYALTNEIKSIITEFNITIEENKALREDVNKMRMHLRDCEQRITELNLMNKALSDKLQSQIASV